MNTKKIITDAKQELAYKNNPNSLFRKYADLVTWFANTTDGRDIITGKHKSLKIPKQKLDLFLPNGFRRIKDFKHVNGVDIPIYETVVTTRSVYSKVLLEALRQFDLLAPYVKDFDEAKRVFAYIMGVKTVLTKKPDVLGAVFFTVSTFYPDPDPESTTIDGNIGRTGVNQTFADIRSGAGVTVDDSSEGNGIYLGSTGTTDQYSDLYRWINLYDTSSIPDGDTVTAAQVDWFGRARGTGLGSLSTSVTGSTPASNTSLATSDYGNVSDTRYATDISSWNTSGYNTLNFNATGISNVSKTGITKLAQRFANDVDNSAPTWASSTASNNSLYAAERTGTSEDPKLTVTHDSAGVSPSSSLSPSSSRSPSSSISPSPSSTR